MGAAVGAGMLTAAASATVGCPLASGGPEAELPVGDSAAAWPLPEVEVCVEPSGEVLVTGDGPAVGGGSAVG